ncbi:DUF2175 domain-containing protein [Caldivirga maquilingensis]|uniref:DUF2175 domain-containing protein n=1 Tax=Caldivirga maquilingensis (strain ATCC 700844 / DSM 13496 / JCM 10307 / IC-167) TaxID=397948 RepID=A8MAU7_CALMQ|nr:DUF2175 domain-containing protein [Caldivirga maquilingensis]ABW01133.1 conserved hypothetical protein [Caldivirga maquilingensis IC-167]
MAEWKCMVCGGNVVDGQLFTFIKGGPIHWSCLVKAINDKFNGKVPSDVLAILTINRHIHEGIVLAKESEQVISDDSVKQVISSRRKLLEGEAAKLNVDMLKLIESKYGVNIP